MRTALVLSGVLLILSEVTAQVPRSQSESTGKVGELKTLLAQLDATDESLKQQIQRLESERAKAEQGVKKLLADNATTSAQLRDANRKIEEIDKELKSRKDSSDALRESTKKIGELAIELSEVKKQMLQNTADSQNLATRLADLEKKSDATTKTATEQKQQAEKAFNIVTVADKESKLKADLADAEGEIRQLRGAGKLADAKTLDEDAVDKWLSLKEWVESNTARYADLHKQMKGETPYSKPPVAQHQALWKEWRDLGIELGKSEARVSDLFRKMSGEASKGITAALQKRDEAITALRELKARR